LKLLFVSNLFPDTTAPYRGLDNATLLHHLADRWRIRVLALRPKLPFLPAPERLPREEDSRFTPTYLDIPYVPKIGSRLNYRIMALFMLETLDSLRLRKEFDVILASWLFPDCCAVARLSKQLDFPFVAIAQGSDVHQYLKMSVRRRIMKKWLPRAAAVVTRSGELARLLGEAGLPAERVHPIYNGVDLEQFRPGDPEAARRELSLPLDRPIILFVGNFYGIKNPHILVEALARLPAAAFPSPPVVVMVGGGPLEGDIRRLAERLTLSERVIFAGRTQAAGVARYMQAADVLCLPSKNEGVPNVILEAFASGLPVVASRIGGISEVHPGDDFGRLVPTITPEAFARAITDTLTDPPTPERLREHALQFSWLRTASAYHDLLSGACR
jgi:glycosyltransferase involved in cell wall biosynthesis